MPYGFALADSYYELVTFKFQFGNFRPKKEYNELNGVGNCRKKHSNN